MPTLLRTGHWWFHVDDIVLIDFGDDGAKVFLRGMGAWSFGINRAEADRLQAILMERAGSGRLPADNELDEQAYQQARDEANDDAD